MVHHNENDKFNDRVFYGFLVFFSLVGAAVAYVVNHG